MDNYIENYLDKIKESIDDFDREKIKKISDIVYNAGINGKNIFLIGNGGSSSTASHIVNDLNKGCFVYGNKRFKAFCLSDNTPLITAWANDDSYENIFANQLATQIERGDVVLAISGSGNSKNILNAVKLANEKDAITIGITGFEGGKIKNLVDECFVVNSDHMGRIEDLHLVLLHMITYQFYERVKNE